MTFPSPAVAAASQTVYLTREQYQRFREDHLRAETNWMLPYVDFTRTCPCGSGLDVEWRNLPRATDNLQCPPCPECPDGR